MNADSVLADYFSQRLRRVELYEKSFENEAIYAEARDYNITNNHKRDVRFAVDVGSQWYLRKCALVFRTVWRIFSPVSAKNQRCT